jgi:hypothetical protein
MKAAGPTRSSGKPHEPGGSGLDHVPQAGRDTLSYGFELGSTVQRKLFDPGAPFQCDSHETIDVVQIFGNEVSGEK